MRVASRIVGRHTRVDESDQIGDVVVAEDQFIVAGAVLVTMNDCRASRKMRGQAASVGRARKKCAGAGAPARLRPWPSLNAEAVAMATLPPETLLRRPHALGANAENLSRGNRGRG